MDEIAYMKFSTKEAFKSAFRIYKWNFFFVFLLSFVSVILSLCILNIVLYFYPDGQNSVTTGILFHHVISILKVLKNLGISQELLLIYLRFILLSLFSFLLVSAFLPAFRGFKIKFRNFLLTSKIVFLAISVTIILATVLLGFSILLFFVFESNFFPDFYVKNVDVPFFILMVLLSFLRYMLVLFYIEIVRDESIVQICKNILKIAPGTFKNFIFCMLLALIDCIVSAVLIPLITKPGIFPSGIPFANPILFALQLPLVILVIMSAYIQMTSSNQLLLIQDHEY